MTAPADLFTRAVEEARLALFWRRRASTVVGCDRRRALALARRCEAAVFNLAIEAESAAPMGGRWDTL